MVKKQPFGRTASGAEVTEYILDNDIIEAHFIDYGCILRKLFVHDRNADERDVVLGYDDISSYENNDGYLGAFVGRVANRIKNAAFKLNGKNYQLYANDGKNCLHGGKIGFDKKIYDACFGDGDKVIFNALSPDGEENFPGNLNVKVTCSVKGFTLLFEYEATSDKDTPVSLTNHSYFNLSAEKTVLGHTLQINSDFITPIDKSLIPTGELMNVADTPFDFRESQKVGRYIDYPHKQLEYAGGYDHNFALKNYGSFEKVATLYAEDTGIFMDVATDNFGMQVYSGNFLSGVSGKNGKPNVRRGALCLETQNYPNAINQPSFPDCVLRAGKVFAKKTSYSFYTDK